VHRRKRVLAGGLLGSVAACAALLGSLQQVSFAGDELYRFSGRKQLQEQQQNQQQAGQAGPEVQLWQQDQRLPANPPPTSQQAGTAGQSILNDKGGPPGTDQLPEGTKTPLPGGGPKMGAGPVGPGGTSRATTDPNEGPNRYMGRPPSWENLNETDAGRNRNEPGAGNTSSATGSNIFGTSPVPFAMGAGNR
jgi:type II secretory pathway pseudopilin PulG